MKKIEAPLSINQISNLKKGEQVLLSGVIYTARDQAHKRLSEEIKNGNKLPFDIKGSIIYYCGPTKAAPGNAIGACGPTTSSRMDAFTPTLLKAGLKGMIGKGSRAQEVVLAIKEYRAVYFVTYAGCGALLSKYVVRSRVVAYPDLGPEAILKLEVRDFPLIVGIDAKGNDIYAAYSLANRFK